MRPREDDLLDVEEKLYVTESEEQGMRRGKAEVLTVKTMAIRESNGPSLKSPNE
jgi:hypothetical protein